MAVENPDNSFVLADPRQMDGTPYQVAERAIRQVAAAARRLADALDVVHVMARNAELERAVALDPDADLKPVAEGWFESPQARNLDAAEVLLGEAAGVLDAVAVAASWDPKDRSAA